MAAILDGLNGNVSYPSGFGTWGDFWSGAQPEFVNPTSNALFQGQGGGLGGSLFYGGIGTSIFESQFGSSSVFSAGAALNPFLSLSNQAAFANAAKFLGSASEGLGLGGAALTIAGAGWQTWQDAHNPSITSQGSAHFYHEMAGSLFGTTGGLLGGVVGEVLIADVALAGSAAFIAPLVVPILVGIAGGALLHGFFNWALPEHQNHTANANNASPSVGGVLFSKCASITGVLPQIKGAYWDSARGVLVLVGPAIAGRLPEQQIMKGLEFDNLLVALRAALAGEHIGVSIDPPAEYRDGILGGKFPPPRTPMYVSYLGNTVGTLFGSILFEADRVMKCLSKGTDNVTGRPLLARKVPGSGTLFDLFNKFKSGGSGSWFRFWFVIDTVEIAHDPSAKAIRFEKVKIKVLNETQLPGGEKVKENPACEAFAQHLTDRYDDYAIEYPIFARLKELAKLSALARFLANEAIAIDERTIFSQPILPVPTPDTTPGIIVSAASSTGGIQSLFGGVDMDVEPTIIEKRDAFALRIMQSAEAARPGEVANIWNFDSTDGVKTACSMRMGSVKAPYRALSSSDHAFEDSWRDTLLSVQRYYDSSIAGGDFGPGWWLFLPYRLQVIPPSRKRREVRLRSEETGEDAPSVVTLHNFIVPSTNIYRRHKEADNAVGLAYCRVNYQEIHNSSVSYSLSESDILRCSKGIYTLADGKYIFLFDGSGQLCETRKSNKLLARYKWTDGLLVAIDYSDSRGYRVQYDRNYLLPRISDIVASDGSCLNYRYDKNGSLQNCFKGKTCKVSYRYDRQLRLSEIINPEGGVVSRNAFGSGGDKVVDTENLVRLADGTDMRREFASGRISVVKDETGLTAEFTYRTNGSLASIKGQASKKVMWMLEYDEEGRLNAATDRFGVKRLVLYDSGNRVERVEGQDGICIQFPDSLKNSKEITGTDRNGLCWSVKLNELGLPDTITDSAKQKYRFRYRNNELKSIKSPGRSLEVVRNNGVLELRTQSESRMQQSWICDRHGKRAQLTVIGPEKEVRSLLLDENGHKVTDCAGTVEYLYNKELLTCDVTVGF